MSVKGSSPLTRGKRLPFAPMRRQGGLIPAHAGKTADGDEEAVSGGAHPRSRGENETQAANASVDAGSSPLTRGKQCLDRPAGAWLGLIPAHAGKTPGAPKREEMGRAHPRSRGENLIQCDLYPLDTGSSPLTRGKRSGVSRSRLMRGLIPAHAGKTASGGNDRTHSWAHPRSRGENKLQKDLSGNPDGLIPAHAGKTTHCATL